MRPSINRCGHLFVDTFFFKNGVFRILLKIFMGFSNPKGGKKTRSIRIKHRYIFHIFIKKRILDQNKPILHPKNPFWTKNNPFWIKKHNFGPKIAHLTFRKKSRFWRSKFLHWKSIKRVLPHLFIDAVIYK